MASGVRRIALLVVRVAVTAIAVGWVLSRVNPGEAWAHLVAAPLWAFLVPPVIIIFNTVLHAVRLQLLLAAAGADVDLRRVLYAVFQAAFVGLVLPTGGSEVAKVALLGRAAGRTEPAVAALVTARLLELPPWTALLVWGIAWGLLERDPALGWVAVVFIAGFGSTMVLAGVLAWRGGDLLEVGRGVLGWLPQRIRWAAAALVVAFGRLRGRRGPVVLAALLAIPFAMLNCSVVWAVLQAYELRLSVGEVFAIIPAADALISLPVSIGGIGVREGLFLHILGPWGAGEALAVAVALTRWTGELARGFVGGVIFVLGDIEATSR